MATGVAHELNQPLVVISMAVENCIRKLGRNKLTDDVASEKFQTIRDQVAVHDYHRPHADFWSPVRR